MKLYYPITVDLYNLYPLKKMDAQQGNIGRGTLVTLTAAGQIMELDKEMITLWAKKPDGTVSYLPCQVVDGKIKADFTNQMLAVAGYVQVELQMIEGEDNITTPIFTVMVHPSNIDSSAVESQNEFGALIQALQEVAELKENGLKGDPGEAATITIGSVTASEPGGVPSVRNSGTEQDAVFDFVIPRGETGPQGEVGPEEVHFGAFADFPIPGEPKVLYVDTSVDPRLLYNWDSVTSKYILAGGAGGEGGSGIDIPITLSSNGWTGEAAPYTQTLTVPQMREGMTPLYFFSGTGDDAQYAYNLILGYEAGYAQMTWRAADLPQVDIPITLKGIPEQQLEYADNTLVVVVPADGFILNEDLGRYEQTIMVEGMAAGANGGWDIVRSGEVLTEAESKIALSITDVIPLDGAIKIVCLWEPGQQYMLKLTGTYTQATEGITLLAGMQGWFDRVGKLEDNIGDKFSETKTYAVGDYCIYEDVLYKFTAAKDAGEWDLTTVASTKVTTELNSLNKSQFIQEHFVSPPSGVSVGASSYVNHVVDVSKQGYIPIALINIWTGNSSIVLYGNTINSLTGRAVIGLRNTSTSSQAGVVQCSVLYKAAE